MLARSPVPHPPRGLIFDRHFDRCIGLLGVRILLLAESNNPLTITIELSICLSILLDWRWRQNIATDYNAAPPRVASLRRLFDLFIFFIGTGALLLLAAGIAPGQAKEETGSLAVYASILTRNT